MYSCGESEKKPIESPQIYLQAVSFQKRTAQLSGNQGVPCDAEPEIQYECIAKNYKNKKPFYAFGSFIGLDSLISLSVAYDGKKVYLLKHDDVFGPESIYEGAECEKPVLSEYSAYLWRSGGPFKCAVTNPGRKKLF